MPVRRRKASQLDLGGNPRGYCQLRWRPKSIMKCVQPEPGSSCFARTARLRCGGPKSALIPCRRRPFAERAAGRFRPEGGDVGARDGKGGTPHSPGAGVPGCRCGGTRRPPAALPTPAGPGICRLSDLSVLFGFSCTKARPWSARSRWSGVGSGQARPAKRDHA